MPGPEGSAARAGPSSRDSAFVYTRGSSHGQVGRLGVTRVVVAGLRLMVIAGLRLVVIAGQ